MTATLTPTRRVGNRHDRNQTETPMVQFLCERRTTTVQLALDVLDYALCVALLRLLALCACRCPLVVQFTKRVRSGRVRD
jgi:hypothetical protein